MWVTGQRVYSQTEPELGLGIVIRSKPEAGLIEVLYSGSDVVRRYSFKNAPLRRLRLSPGQKATGKKGESFQVREVREEEHVYRYVGENGETLWEYELSDEGLDDQGPLDQFLAGRWTRFEGYELRQDAWRVRAQGLDPDVCGLVGPRVGLLPHQLHIASEVSRRESPRVLLSDEVGLGKTIEAGLIFSSLRARERANRVLVLIPESLKHQWLAEMYRRFNTLFTVMDEDRFEDELETSQMSPFKSNQQILCSLDFLLANPARLDLAVAENWDLIIVDEAHHLEWKAAGEPSARWTAVQRLSDKSRGLLLLTATPKLGGLETQFGLLSLADPERFTSFKEFTEEAHNMKTVAALAGDLMAGNPKPETAKAIRARFPDDKDLLAKLKGLEAAESYEKAWPEIQGILRALVDRHGTGRMLYRNRRERIQGFPERELHSHPLEPDAKHNELLAELDAGDDEAVLQAATGRLGLREALAKRKPGPRERWFLEFLKGLPPKRKVLALCSSASTVLHLDRWLQESSGIKRALFHEELELIDRDRQAAWFAEPSGAQLLLCSEIGGEGRNFQFCHEIVMLDIPPDPDLLEQRIGRLDRIGQTEKVRIHVPWIEGTPEEALFEWFRSGLRSFEKAWNGSGPFLVKLRPALLEVCRAFLPGTKPALRQRKMDELLRATHDELERFRHESQEAVDALIDFNSFDPEHGRLLTRKIEGLESDRRLRRFMGEAFEFFGVDQEDFDERGSLKVSAGSLMFVESFPELPPHEEKVVTFSRELAVAREEFVFLTQDHPMVQGVLGLILEKNEGRATACFYVPARSGDLKLQGIPALFQFLFTVHCSAPVSLEIERYLPLDIFEVNMSYKGEEVEALSFDPGELKKISDAFLKGQLGKFLEQARRFLPGLHESAARGLQAPFAQSLEEAKAQAQSELSTEHERLRSLARMNRTVSKREIDQHKARWDHTLEALGRAQLRLDSVRMVLNQS